MVDREKLEEVANTGENYELEELAETEHSYLVVSRSEAALSDG